MKDKLQGASKVELRRMGRARRRAYQGVERIRSEAEICAHILGTPILREVIESGRFISAYLPFDGEVSLVGLWGGEAEPLWRGAKHISLHPEISSDDHIASRLRDHLVFPRHQSGQPLSFVRPERWSGPGPLPLPEGPEVPLKAIGALLVPGVLFEQSRRGRIGLGGGHYDRTLASRAETTWSAVSFGVGFTFQVRPHLPLDPWDVSLDGIITERGLIE